LLGQHEWIKRLIKLPTQHIYVLANAIEQDQTIPQGVKFCDAPALYSSVWPDLIHAYQQNPVAMSYQRLLAFGWRCLADQPALFTSTSFEQS
jgi:outer membrane PBP1 activator LpoA protein